MKTILFSIAAALAISAMPLAHAQDTSVQIKAGARYRMDAQEFTTFKNTYELTNGQRLAFSQRMTQFFVQLDDGDRVRIYPVSSSVFVTEAGTRIAFRDEAETVGVSNFEKLPMAAHLPANTIVMARR